MYPPGPLLRAQRALSIELAVRGAGSDLQLGHQVPGVPPGSSHRLDSELPVPVVRK